MGLIGLILTARADKSDTLVNVVKLFSELGGMSLNLFNVLCHTFYHFLTALNKTLYSTLSLLVVSFICVMTIIYILLCHLLKPVQVLVDGMARVGRGDLTASMHIPVRDEFGLLGGSFNKMLGDIRNLIGRAETASIQLAAAGHQLKKSTGRTEQGVQEVASTMEQLTSTVQQIAASSEDMSHKANGVLLAAGRGEEVIVKAVSQMESIHETVGKLAINVEGLGTRSNQISRIVEVITNITDQTSMLALNASIEAARAGEHGRGFAVVAAEVNKLADQSVGAAREIANLIGKIQSETAQAVEGMEAAREEVEGGVRLIGITGDNFKKISELVGEIVGEIQSVAAAVQELSGGSQQVAATTREQTFSMEQISRAISSLVDSADELKSTIEKFKIN